MSNSNYSFTTTIGKVIKYGVIYAIPFLVDAFIYQMPTIANLTIGSVLVGLVNYLKVKGGVRML